MGEQRYTLSLPPRLYEELREQAEKHDTSIREVVRQLLKFGLVAMKLDDDPSTELIIREKISSAEDSDDMRETRLRFIF